MADWIKVEKATARKPEVLQVAMLMGIHPDHAFGLCVRFWMWCDDNMTDGTAKINCQILDAVIGTPGFAQALIDSGWLKDRKNALEIPNFDRHLSQSAKVRCAATERKRNSRSSAETSQTSQKSVTSVTKKRDQRREDERREYKQHTPPAGETGPASPPDLGPRETWLPGESPAFKRFFAAYPRKSAPAKAWTVWQATVASLIGQRGQSDAEIEAFLIDRAAAYAGSPAGLPPPPGQDDFRPAPARWLQDGKYDEPFEEWQKPNAKAKHGTDGNPTSRSSRRAATPAAEAVRPTEDLDAWFDQVVSSKPGKPAGGVAQTPTEGISSAG